MSISYSIKHITLCFVFLLCAVTPSGSCSSPPKEYQEGESGFAVMFPNMEGVHIKPFHFCKKSIFPTALKEAGECRQICCNLNYLVFKNVIFVLLFYCICSGLIDNPDLRVVLIFVYEAYKPGGARFLNQILEPLAKSKALIAGGLVESAFSPPRHW